MSSQKKKIVVGLGALGVAGGAYYAYQQSHAPPVRIRMVHRKYTDFLGSMAEYSNIPQWLRTPMMEVYAKIYGVNKEEMVAKDFGEFKNFQEFFTRAVKPRTIDPSPENLVAPADAQLLSIAKVETDEVLAVKKRTYSLCEFVTDSPGCQFSQEQIRELKRDPNADLYSLVFYLSPGDYHRFHSPCDFEVKGAQHSAGGLQSVSISSIERNSV